MFCNILLLSQSFIDILIESKPHVNIALLLTQDENDFSDGVDALQTAYRTYPTCTTPRLATTSTKPMLATTCKKPMPAIYSREFMEKLEKSIQKFNLDDLTNKQKRLEYPQK